MKLFLDTEFTTLNMHDDPKLISIGLVNDADERSFYAELSDHYQLRSCSPFVMDEVIPLLDAKKIGIGLIHMQHVHIKANTLIIHRLLKDWIGFFDGPIQLMVDSPLYDIPMLQQLLVVGEGLAHMTNTVINVTPEGYDAQIRYQCILDDCYLTNGLRCHHALDDAIAMRLSYQTMNYPHLKP